MKKLKLKGKKYTLIVILIVILILVLISLILFGIKNKNKDGTEENNSNIISETQGKREESEIDRDIKECEENIEKLNKEILKLRNKIYNYGKGFTDDEIKANQEEYSKVTSEMNKKEAELNTYQIRYAELIEEKNQLKDTKKE